MRTQLSLVLGFALAACTKEPPPAPPGRPIDVCAGVSNQVDCGIKPEGPLPEGFDAAANCYTVGNQQFHCGLFEAAAGSFQRATQMKPDARYFHAYGDALYLQEKWQSAHEAFRKAVELDPKKRESWARVAEIGVRLHLLDEVHDAAQKALAIDPSKPDVMRAEAEAYAADSQFDKAIDELHAAEKLGTSQNKLECAQQEVEIASLKLKRLQKDGGTDDRIADAQEQVADALERELSFGDGKIAEQGIYRSLADARLAAGQFDKAEAALLKSSEMNPKDFISARMVGMIREQRHDTAGARQALQASLKVEPKQAMPYIVLGRIDAAAGDMPSAKKDFDEALKNEDGKDALETRQLAELATKVGAKDKAEALYKSLDEDPDQSARVDFWLDQAAASNALGHADDVKKACKRAHALVETETCPPKPDASQHR
ncbi:MAG: tetratricopeptide repeat protein [Deltaproteobacteria bacterium]|nr:tetratricopeptide repeat protein [Deltaproteobacteria bacterium]